MKQQAHCFEWVLLHDTFIGYDDKGRVLPVTEMKPRMQDFSFSRSQLSRDAEHTKALAPSSLKALPIPRLLSWDLSGPAVDDILKAVEEVSVQLYRFFCSVSLSLRVYGDLIGMHCPIGEHTNSPCRLVPETPRLTYISESMTRTARA